MVDPPTTTGEQAPSPPRPLESNLSRYPSPVKPHQTCSFSLLLLAHPGKQTKHIPSASHRSRRPSHRRRNDGYLVLIFH